MDKSGVPDAILIGLERTACIIARCAAYELLYLSSARTAAADNLQMSTVLLYTEILKFVAKAIAKSEGAQPGEILIVVALTVLFPRGSPQCSSRDRVDDRLLQRCQRI